MPKLRELAEVQRLLHHFDVMLEEPIPPIASEEWIGRIEFARDVVLWMLNDERGQKFAALVDAFNQADAEIEASFFRGVLKASTECQN